MTRQLRGFKFIVFISLLSNGTVSMSTENGSLDVANATWIVYGSREKSGEEELRNTPDYFNLLSTSNKAANLHISHLADKEKADRVRSPYLFIEKQANGIRISPDFDFLDTLETSTAAEANQIHSQELLMELDKSDVVQSTICGDEFAVCQNQSNATDVETTGIEWRSVALGILLGSFCVITIGGNLLVIIAVSRERYLRSVTNYLVVSLACADIIVGVIVMPFAITLEITDQYWYFGLLFCDLWHSFDVLGSTASILNLCVISLDRYWAVSDPIQYPRKMSRSRASFSIFLVWLCSALISFPAIAWWREVTPVGSVKETECIFTDNTAYLILSSMVSFYIPLFIMIFVYVRIYRTAVKQIQSLKSGSKKLSHSGGKNGVEVLLLRVHRGGTAHLSPNGTLALDNSASRNGTLSPGVSSLDVNHQHGEDDFNSNSLDGHSSNSSHGTATFIKRKLRNFAVKKRLSKIARERKAAKTLGIVMGVFVCCWLPFFSMNLLLAICKTCIGKIEIVFPVFTWLGYINSGMNPVIYACSMKDFRRAFIRIACAFSSKRRRKLYMKRLRNKRYRSSEFYSSTCLSGLSTEYSSVNAM